MEDCKNFRVYNEYCRRIFGNEKVNYLKQVIGFEFLINNDDGKIIYITKEGCNAGVACVFKYFPENDIINVILANQDCNVWDLEWEIQELLIGKID
jgi:hypothetical protein